ncbi:MAG: FkbM family methyltransferase [Sphaerospermopsis sp. SIO1G1]|nr:FkbM family methyltransferase [Sphaerospermopsis sp. SIO1G1]
MNSKTTNDHSYINYLQNLLETVSSETLDKIYYIIDQTSWDEPNNTSDWNNIAVVAMTEAEQSEDLTMRSMYLEIAFDALNNGLEIDRNPILAAHLALINSWVGEKNQALEIAYNAFINAVHYAYNTSEKNQSYLMFLSIKHQKIVINDQKILEQVLSENIFQQVLVLLSQIICTSQIAFYNTANQRFLYLANQTLPNLTNLNLKLGISNLIAGQIEGILYLQQARKLQPDSSSILQSLYLAYRDLKQIPIADYWLKQASEFYQNNSSDLQWQWTQLPLDSSFTYLPFENDITIAVEPSLKSIVTSVLLAEQDWFEKEMEFWRSYIKPGMTVIDVGANIGVYTFSAALKVGNTGRVLAVEPFSGCVRCLQETCRINNLSWVKVCAGAASDKNSTIKLLLHTANELNEVITDNTIEIPVGSFEEVPCFTLDSLIEKENIQQVDFLKMDAEGHEMAVLSGGKKLINQFKPVILYENIAGSQGSNIGVAQYLENIGYQLFYYQPFIQQLIPVNSPENYQQLNFIAVPQ